MTLRDSVIGESGFFFFSSGLSEKLQFLLKMEKILSPKCIVYIFTHLILGGKQQQTLLIHM